MEINKWCLRKKYISQLEEYRRTHMYSGSVVTLQTIIALLDIIPIELLGVDSCRHSPRVEVYTGFKNVDHCQQWLYRLNVTLTKKQYFKDYILMPTLHRQEMTMEEFLVDNRGMSYIPSAILTTLRRTIMDVNKSYNTIMDAELKEYYEFKFKGILPELNHVVQCFANLALEVDYE